MQFVRNNKALILSIITISLPAIIEMALNTLVGMADTIMISKYIGNEAISAAGNANQLVFTIIFVFSSFNVGATALISRSYGEKNYSRLNQVAGQNLFFNILIGIVITILSVAFGSHTMRIFDTTKEVFEMSVSYLNIVSYSQIFMFISFAVSASLRGVEDTRTPMFVTSLVNILNIIGNYLLINGIGIFPKMGIEGAALSTTISRGVGAVLYIVILLRGNEYLKLKLMDLRITKEIFRPLWNLSSSAGLEQFLMQTSFFAMGIIITILDTTSEAAFRILITIESISYMPAIGISIAAATLVGKALGEKDKNKAIHTGYISIGLGILWGIFIGIVFLLFPAQIAGIFSNDPEVIKELIVPLIIAGFDQPLLGFVIVISGALRGAGDTRTVMVLTSIRLWFVFVPLTYILIRFWNVGIKSVWISEIIALLIFNLIMLRRFQEKKWADIEI
ncbi:MAG: MATE family efflux transporter [Bacillota bacterium]